LAERIGATGGIRPGIVTRRRGTIAAGEGQSDVADLLSRDCGSTIGIERRLVAGLIISIHSM
jgi:hypothetical protein